jgi:HD-like signal output (HDOD) protein
VDSGPDALEALAAEPFDAVVTDMRMPGMNGGELLTLVQQRYPATARIVLSGQADRSAVLTAVACAHQFLAKPCDAATLVAVIGRVLAARQLLADPLLQELIGGVVNLPTLPDVYHQLIAAASSPDCTVDEVAKIIGSDVATSVEVLKLTNSAFFGLSRKIESVSQAVSLLGLDNIQALVVAGTTFRPQKTIPGLNIKALRQYALQRTAMIQRIAAAQKWKPEETTPLALAAMLRDVGLLVLASGHPEAGCRLIEQLNLDPTVLDDPIAVKDLEVAAFGCAVPQASAYLLGLWGFSPGVVHALAGQPAIGDEPGVTERDLALTLVHQRVLRPDVPIQLPLVGGFSTEVLQDWNAACDQVLETTARNLDTTEEPV